jgi:ABC-type glycerol-3-phosphate transport system substrate-binding protein
MSQSVSRRTFLRNSALLMAGVALVGCAPAAPQGAGDEAAPGAARVTIRYYDRTTDAPRWADKYNEAQDKVTVEVEIQPPDTRYEQLVAAITADNAPDVIGLDCVQVGRFAQLGALLPLGDLIPADVQARYFEGLIKTERRYGLFEGNLVGVPFWVDNSVCFYNKRMLEEVGGDPEVGIRSWEEHVTYGKAIAEQDVFGFSTGTVNSFLFGPWVWAQGGDFTDAEWTRSRCDEPEVRNMLQFARDLQNEHKITNDAPATDWGTMMSLFENQKALSVYMGGGLVGIVRNEFPELWEVLGTCPIPGPEVGQISSFIGGNVASISSKSQVQSEALDYLIWLTAEDEGMTVTGELGFLPGCPAGLELEVYQKDADIYKAFGDALQFGYPAGNDPRFDEVQLTPLNVAWTEALLNEKSMDEIINTLHDTINGVLQR